MKAILNVLAGVVIGACLVVGTGCASGGGGGGGGGPTPVGPDANAGQATYTNECMACHGAPEAGDGTAPDLADDTPEELQNGVTSGTHPDVADLTQNDYANLAAFLADENGGGDGSGRINLNVVKLDVSATTQRGPAVGDGVLAFDAEGGNVLAWLAAGETQPREVPAPADMNHDRDAFAFGGATLVVRDRNSGSLYLFDTDTEQVAALPSRSIDMGGAGGPNLWEVENNLIATVNSWVVTDDGLHKLIKVVDISDINAPVITPFDVDPTETPDAIALDAGSGRVVVRGGEVFYVYDIDAPNAGPTEFRRAALEGGTGSADVQMDGDFVAFFDDDENFTLLNVGTGEFTQPNRNPGRSNRGLSLEDDRFSYFAMQTEDDGSSIAQANRALVGTADNPNDLIDPPGTWVNRDETEGRVGFGATVDISPNERFVFVAGETAVGVDETERLYLSIDGGDFLIVEDSQDSLNAQRAAGVAAGDNLVAFLIPASDSFSSVSIGYATLPPQ